MIAQPTVYIVDDEPEMCNSLRMLVRSAGYDAKTFTSGEEFLEAFQPDFAGCLVLDVQLPGVNGIEVQAKLAACGSSLPVIMISGYTEVSDVVSAIRRGAIDFLEKPFEDESLLGCIRKAMGQEEGSACSGT